MKLLYISLTFLMLNSLTVSLNSMFEQDATHMQDRRSTVKDAQLHKIKKHKRKPIAHYLAQMYQKAKLNAKSAWQELQNKKITKATALKGTLGLTALAATAYAVLQSAAQKTPEQAIVPTIQKIKSTLGFVIHLKKFVKFQQ